MTTRRADKAVLLFNGGEVTPLLDGRSDVERVAGSCRTLQNMFVDEAGAAIRRPGLEFVAEVGGAAPLSHVSYEGTATLYGITELASVSDPPRKYLQLVPNYAGFFRQRSTTADLYMGFSSFNRTAYDTTGARIGQVFPWGDNFAGAPWGSGAGKTLNSPGDSLESTDWSGSSWEGYEPAWTKTRLAKYFEAADLPAPSDLVAERFGYGQGFGWASSPSQTRGLGVFISWTGTSWQLRCDMFGEGARSARFRIINGDRDPGDVGESDIQLLAGSTQFLTTTIFLPPDTSIRFRVKTDSVENSVQIPQQIDTKIVNAAEAASGLTVDAYDRWIYLPATEAELPTWRFEETLCNEDTLTAAIQRSSDVEIGTEAVAATTFVSGGTAAESNQPLNWTGRVVRTSKVITGLTIGHRYSVSVLVRTNTIGSNDFSTTTEEGEEFVALATSTQVTYEVRAGLGKEKRVINISVEDEGAEPAAPSVYDSDAILWQGRVLANGGTLESDSLQIASDLVTALKAAGVWSKCCYFLPLLGADLAAMLVPLRDRDSAGNATNTGFAEADFDQATGLQGNGSSKHLVIPRTPGEIGSSSNGGLGYWSLDGQNNGTATAGIGTNNSGGTQAFLLIPKRATSNESIFFWGGATTGAGAVQTAWTGWMYGQRASATSRAMYLDNVLLDSDATSDSANDPNDNDFRVLGDISGAGTNRFTNGRCGCAWLDDGTLTSDERADLYEIIRDELMIPTGRITP